MALDLSKTLVVGISATALFDMSESDQIFRAIFDTDRDTAIDRYREYMLAHENEPLTPGTGFPLVKALLALNTHLEIGEKNPLVEVVIMSREGANKRGNSSRLTQSFHFFMFEPIFSPVNALNQPI